MHVYLHVDCIYTRLVFPACTYCSTFNTGTTQRPAYQPTITTGRGVDVDLPTQHGPSTEHWLSTGYRLDPGFPVLSQPGGGSFLHFTAETSSSRACLHNICRSPESPRKAAASLHGCPATPRCCQPTTTADDSVRHSWYGKVVPNSLSPTSPPTPAPCRSTHWCGSLQRGWLYSSPTANHVPSQPLISKSAHYIFIAQLSVHKVWSHDHFPGT